MAFMGGIAPVKPEGSTTTNREFEPFFLDSPVKPEGSTTTNRGFTPTPTPPVVPVVTGGGLAEGIEGGTGTGANFEPVNNAPGVAAGIEGIQGGTGTGGNIEPINNNPGVAAGIEGTEGGTGTVDVNGNPSSTDTVIDPAVTDPVTDPGTTPPTVGQPGLAEFFKQLGLSNSQFLNNPMFQQLQQGLFGANGQGGLGGDLAGLQKTQFDIASGKDGGDPRFEAFKQSQLQQLASDQQGQQARQGEFFSRRGLGGSSAALNQQNKLSSSFGQQSQNLASQIGMQQLGRQDQALLNQQNIVGQRAGLTQLGAGLEEQRLGQVTAGLENLTIGEQLSIGRLAAENAGKSPGGDSGGGFDINNLFDSITNLFS